jgi:hypothetical protein
MLKLLRGADPTFFDRSAPNRTGLYMQLGTPASGSLPVLYAN